MTTLGDVTSFVFFSIFIIRLNKLSVTCHSLHGFFAWDVVLLCSWTKRFV